MLDGKFMYNTLKAYLPEDSLIISPNGPFLIPHKKEQSFVARYSWYFFDSEKKHFYINFEPAAQMLSSMLDTIAPNIPVTVIGYSQGGYLAPKVAELYASVDKVIGIACTFRNNKFRERDIEYHQIHSKQDIVVEYKGSKDEFIKLRNPGKYIEIDDIGHKLGPAYFEALKNLI